MELIVVEFIIVLAIIRIAIILRYFVEYFVIVKVFAANSIITIVIITIIID